MATESLSSLFLETNALDMNHMRSRLLFQYDGLEKKFDINLQAVEELGYEVG